jgi:hypothetical protein
VLLAQVQLPNQNQSIKRKEYTIDITLIIQSFNQNKCLLNRLLRRKMIKEEAKLLI